MEWFEDYDTYLKSDCFARLKEEVRIRCGGNCERCLVNKYKHTHHVIYEKKWGTETSKNLAGVCPGCHNLLGGYSDDDPLDHLQPTIFLTGDIRGSRLDGGLKDVTLYNHENNCKIEELAKKCDYVFVNVLNKESTYLNDEIEYACKKGLTSYVFFPIVNLDAAVTLRKSYDQIFKLQDSGRVHIYYHQSAANVLTRFYTILDNWKTITKDKRSRDFEIKAYLKRKK